MIHNEKKREKVEYDIVKTKDPEAIKFFLPLAKVLIEKNKVGYTFENFATWCRGNIKNPACGFWLCIKRENNKILKNETQIVGYAIAVMMNFVGEEQVFIYHIFSKDKDVKTAQDIFDTVAKWGKDNGINKVSGLVSKPKGMCKIFGAEAGQTMIVKEI